MAARQPSTDAGRARSPPPQPSRSDRFWLWWSKSRHVNGLWIGAEQWTTADVVLRRVEEALRLIKQYDERRFNRLLKDLERVWVRLLPGYIGSFNDSISACVLDSRFVLAEDSSPDVIAATIVHEAAHARLMRSRIGY